MTSYPVGKFSQKSSKTRRIAVALFCEKFVFAAKIRRIAKNSHNFFSKNFVFWAKIRRIAKYSHYFFCEEFVFAAKIRCIAKNSHFIIFAMRPKSENFRKLRFYSAL